MNQHDSQRVRELLSASGYQEASSVEKADLVLVNTCSVREKAVQKLRSELGRLGRLKQSRPDLLLGVSGCVAQERGRELLRKLPYLDLVLGPDCLSELPQILRNLEAGGPPCVRTEFDVESPRFLSARPQPARQPPTAYVTVAKGCDEGCTFCIVPQTRGPERHRPSDEIVVEIGRLVGAGTREVILLGQTVNGYRDPTRETSDFPMLLRTIAAQVPGLLRLRYMSPHPRHLSPGLIETHAEVRALCRHLHLPVQSGSDRILRRMVRRHTTDEYLKRVQALRERVPDLTLSTDIIVGFPGETADDFAATLGLVKKVGFVGVFGFKYSPRPNTPALRLRDDVQEAEKSRRLTELFRLSDELQNQHLVGLVERQERVLVEGPTQDGVYTGRTDRNEIVHFGSREDLTGQLVTVRITTAFRHSLGAELLDPAVARPLPPERRLRLKVI